MRLRMKRMLLAVLAAAMSLVLSGCFVKTVDELYTLPKHSDEYNRLEQAIDQVMSSQNASYAAPVSGMNQQSVQLADLDGDGTEEVVAFLKTTGDKPLKLHGEVPHLEAFKTGGGSRALHAQPAAPHQSHE